MTGSKYTVPSPEHRKTANPNYYCTVLVFSNRVSLILLHNIGAKRRNRSSADRFRQIRTYCKAKSGSTWYWRGWTQNRRPNDRREPSAAAGKRRRSVVSVASFVGDQSGGGDGSGRSVAGGRRRRLRVCPPTSWRNRCRPDGSKECRRRKRKRRRLSTRSSKRLRCGSFCGRTLSSPVGSTLPDKTVCLSPSPALLRWPTIWRRNVNRWAAVDVENYGGVITAVKVPRYCHLS